MPQSRRRIPKYRHYKPKDLAVVRIDGQDRYLGRYNSEESWEKFHRLIAEWLADGRQAGPATDKAANPTPSPSVNEVMLAYWRFAKSHYVKDGVSTRALDGMREALRPLRELYGRTGASEFGPRKLKAIREHMIGNGLSRQVINHRTGRIKRFFKWATAEELVPASVYHGLQAVAGLTFGRTSARETEPVRPVVDLHVTIVLPFLSPHVAAMVRLQRLTGMRTGELVIMRPCDIDTSGDVWIYEPSDHKGRWRGHRKQIPLGPAAQAVLTPFMARCPQSFLFSPVESEQWRRENRPPYQGRRRKTPLYPSELKRREMLKAARRGQTSRRPKRDRYDTNTYRKAIEYGLQKATKAGFPVPHWHPHQLRHNRGTEVRRKYGIEAAQVALGHARANVTQVYAEKNMEQAKQIAKEMG